LSSLAIIAARGGSKRIPRKNVKSFCGRPIIEYSIEAALKSNCFADVIVSTDDQEIAEVATQAGASVPFMRSAASSNDHAGLEEVSYEVLHAYAASGKTCRDFCLMLPTAPFVTAARLEEGRNILRNSRAESVVPVVAFSYPVQRALEISEDGHLTMVAPEFYDTRSQDIPRRYHDAGQFYWMKSQAALNREPFFGDKAKALVLKEQEVHDIDTLEDWEIAEFKYIYFKSK
jgi:pseudaminic acid cytidylyltransferase